MENTISLYERGTGYNRRGKYYGVQYPRTSDGDLLKLEIMIWIFDICED